MRRGLIGVTALLITAVIILAALAVALDAGYFRGPLVGYLERSTGRKITVSGPLQVHLLSRHPSVSAQGVTVGNPPWTPPGITAQIERVTLVYDMPRWGTTATHPKACDCRGAQLTLFRDVTGHANWQRRNPDENKAREVPLIASLTASSAHVILDDERASPEIRWHRVCGRYRARRWRCRAADSGHGDPQWRQCRVAVDRRSLGGRDA